MPTRNLLNYISSSLPIGYTGSAGPVAGSNTTVAFNDSGSANGTTGFTFTKSSNSVFVANTITAGMTVVANNGIFVNNSNVTTSYTIASGYNGGTIGPVNIANGVTVTVTSGQRWLIF